MSGLSEVVLTGLLERAFLPTVPGSRSIADLGCERLENVGWYGAYRLDLRLEDGSPHALFLKDFGTPRGPKDDLGGRRERERRVYERLLDSKREGTARYYGCEWDPEVNRFWLLLEWVEGEPLRYQELEVWYRAAAWLARLHAMSRDHRVGSRSLPWLRQLDAGFFLGTANRAVAEVSVWSAEAGTRLETELAPYRERVRRLSTGSETLVHGAFLPIQILVASCGRGERLCPLDWELASLGSPAYDLGFLSYGFDDHERAALLGAYNAEAERLGLSVDPDLNECVTLVEVHRTLDALSRSVDRAYEDDAIGEYLSVLDRLLARTVGRTDPLQPADGRYGAQR